MIVLALDTAGVDCAVAIYDSSSETLLASVSETIGRGHAERLMEMVDQALDAAKLSLKDVSRIGVTIGPGSFTGIRVGVATARGLALALGVECVGVGTLHVLALTAERQSGPVISAMNAHRDEIYMQRFEAGLPVSEPELTSLDHFLDAASDPDVFVAGSASLLLQDRAAQTPPDHFPILHVARLAAVAKAQGKPSPLYLRGPDAKPQTGFAVARA